MTLDQIPGAEIDDRAIEARLLEAVRNNDSAGVEAELDPLIYSDALRILLNLSESDRNAAFALMPAQLAAEMVEEAPHEMAAALVANMAPAKAAEVLDELTSDVQADVVAEMDSDHADAVLGEMETEDAADVLRLISYPEGTAGALMTAEAFSFPQDATVGTILRRLAGQGDDDDEDFERYRGQHPYILDDAGRPVGVVSLRNLLNAKRSTKLSAVMVPAVAVGVETPLEDLESLFDEHPFLGLPVVEADGRLAGALSRAAVDEALARRAESENLRRHGVIGDELRSMPLWLRSRRRLAWLSANIVLNIIAASVISAYEETLAAVIAIAIFLPMVSDMSGCSGNQAVGVTMRELALGLVRPVDAFRVWTKEVTVGLINGAALGVLIGLVAWVWKGNPWLGLVIGAALALNTVIAVSIGGVVPLLLKRLGQDPAAASGPLLTTITDMAGFFLVLSFASMAMPLLLQGGG